MNNLLAPSASTGDPLVIDVWLDIACPWCALGHKRLSSVIAALPFKHQVDLRIRSYQLMPGAPEHSNIKQPEYLAGRGMDMARFRQAQQQLVQMGAEYDFHFDQNSTIPSNSLTAHRLIQAAKAPALAARSENRDLPSVQGSLVAALFSAYFERGLDIGDHQVLRVLAQGAGLPEDLTLAVLSDPTAYADDVSNDIREAAELSVTGVPFILLGGRYSVSGAQPAPALEQAIRQVFAEHTS